MSNSVILEKDKKSKIATISLNRPEALNAMLLSDWEEMNSFIRALNQDDDVKVCIIKGIGRAFSSGHDLRELAPIYAGKPGERRPSVRQKLRVDAEYLFGRRGIFTTIATCWKATICQVHGYCYGGGLYIAMASDIVIAADNSSFTHPGWLYLGPISTWQLIMNVGVKRAKAMMLEGKPITAEEGYEWGLVNKVVPLDRIDKEVRQVAESVARLPLDGIVLGKQQFEYALDAMGMYQGYGSMAATHTLQTYLRLEPEEFNLMKEMRDKGARGAFRARKAFYDESKETK